MFVFDAMLWTDGTLGSLTIITSNYGSDLLVISNERVKSNCVSNCAGQVYSAILVY